MRYSITEEGADYLYPSGYIYDMFDSQNQLICCIQSPTPLDVQTLNRISQSITYGVTFLGDVRTFIRSV